MKTGVRTRRLADDPQTGMEFALVTWRGLPAGMVGRSPIGEVGAVGAVGRWMEVRREALGEDADLAGADWNAIRRAVRETLSIPPREVLLRTVLAERGRVAHRKPRQLARR